MFKYSRRRYTYLECRWRLRLTHNSWKSWAWPPGTWRRGRASWRWWTRKPRQRMWSELCPRRPGSTGRAWGCGGRRRCYRCCRWCWPTSKNIFFFVILSHPRSPQRIFFRTRSVFVFLFFLSKGNNFHSYCSCKTRKVKSCDKGLTHSDRHLLGHHRKSYVATLVQTTADHPQGHHRLCRQRANVSLL